MNPNFPIMCPGTHQKPDQPNTCPVCEFEWLRVKFEHMTPTHGLVSEHQKDIAIKWAAAKLDEIESTTGEEPS